ncbi:MAG: amino acid ABC transporter permease [Rubritepida sp.]|jgi:polar amino acid transport system permease protein|nr:amino acid ABC transporter permease [Rubritepida sp.]
MEKLVETFFNVRVMAEYAPKIVEGFFLTVQLALAVVVTGIAAGLLLAAVRSFRVKPVNALIVVFVDVLRALPPLVLIILLYFALPSLGIRLSGFVSTWLALSMVLAAFAEEIFWAGILAVPKGQWEAARSTGLGALQTLAHVVLPQAVRLTIPPLTNRTIAITKGTALGAVVAVGEILYQAQSGYSFSYNPSPLTLGAIAYLILFIPVVWLGRWVETRFAWKR